VIAAVTDHQLLWAIVVLLAVLVLLTIHAELWRRKRM
jgi:hypothetical protein